jgi:hypothetical protein
MQGLGSPGGEALNLCNETGACGFLRRKGTKKLGDRSRGKPTTSCRKSFGCGQLLITLTLPEKRVFHPSEGRPYHADMPN